METSDWVLLVTVLLVGGGVTTALILSSRLRAKSALAAADMVDRWHKRDVEQRQAKIAELKKNFDAHQAEIDKLEHLLDIKRSKLSDKYKAKGASTHEILDRLERLGL